MREILFRGKRKDNGEWIEGSLILTTSTMEKPYIVDSCWCYSGSVDDEGYAKFEYLNAYEVIPESVSEFTGLTDKNGKKIFEGDIIAWNDGETDTNGICFDDELFSIEFSCKEVAFVANYEVYGEERLDGLDTSYATVIGNIHDNPKLLKGGADNDF